MGIYVERERAAASSSSGERRLLTEARSKRKPSCCALIDVSARKRKANAQECVVKSEKVKLGKGLSREKRRLIGRLS